MVQFFPTKLLKKNMRNMFYHNYYRVIAKHYYTYKILQCPQNHTLENKTKQNKTISSPNTHARKSLKIQ